MSKRILGDDPFAVSDEKNAEAAAPATAGASRGKRKGKRKQEAAPAPTPPPVDENGETEVIIIAELPDEDEAPPIAEAAGGAAVAAAPAPEPEPEPEPVVVEAPPADEIPVERHLHVVPEPARAHELPPRLLPMAPLWQTVRRVTGGAQDTRVDDMGYDAALAARVEPALDFLYRRWFRVAVDGLGNVPAEGRAILIANHAGTLPYDAAMLMHAVAHHHPAGRRVRPLVEDFVFHFPYLGPLVNRLGGVRACPENAERLLAQDEVVAVFPEGIKGIGKRFLDRYQLQRFGRGGFVKLALATRTPIVPTAIVGSEEIHPVLARLDGLAKLLGLPYLPVTPTFPWLGPLGLVPLPSKWTIAFGEPIDLAVEHGPDAARDRALVGKLAETVRARIQSMVDELVAKRKSVFFG